MFEILYNEMSFFPGLKCYELNEEVILAGSLFMSVVQCVEEGVGRDFEENWRDISRRRWELNLI